MKRWLSAALFFVAFSAKAQHSANDQVTSMNWDVIGGVEFRIVNNSKMIPKFTPLIKKYENGAFELEGYIVPIQEGLKQSKFMLSTLPINQCYFCGQNGVPIMVYVELESPMKYTYRTVKIRGNLKLNPGNAMDSPPVSLMKATARE